jgi:hypothetical protein
MRATKIAGQALRLPMLNGQMPVGPTAKMVLRRHIRFDQSIAGRTFCHSRWRWYYRRTTMIMADSHWASLPLADLRLLGGSPSSLVMSEVPEHHAHPAPDGQHIGPELAQVGPSACTITRTPTPEIKPPIITF